MRIVYAVVMMVALAGPAFAQATPVPKAGEATGKSETEIRDEKEAERAYQKSLSNIPAQKAPDPWGTVRSENAPKTVAKDPPAKRAKPGGTPN